MGVVIKPSDFVGTFALSNSLSSKVEPYITEYEVPYLMKLLGVELYKKFKIDLDLAPAGEPTAAIYKAIYNPIQLDQNKEVIVNQGMKSLLLGLIWFQFVRITKYKHTDGGVIVDVNEISKNANWSDGFIQKRYNESVHDWRVIQWFICDNSGDYPDYNGQPLAKVNVI